MRSDEAIQNYINNFRRRISRFLKPGIGMRCNIYPSDQAGAILEFWFGRNEKNEDIYNPADISVNENLRKINQSAFGGDLSAFHFGGTNILLEPNRVILVKGGDNPEEWNDEAAKSDTEKVLSFIETSKK